MTRSLGVKNSDGADPPKRPRKESTQTDAEEYHDEATCTTLAVRSAPGWDNVEVGGTALTDNDLAESEGHESALTESPIKAQSDTKQASILSRKCCDGCQKTSSDMHWAAYQPVYDPH